MGKHALYTSQNVHAVVARTYADIADRDNDVPLDLPIPPATTVPAFQVAENVDRVVRVNSPLSYYILTAATPTWSEFTTTGNDTFLELLDTISAYDGAGKVQQINATNDGLESGQELRTTDSPTFAGMDINGNLIVIGTFAEFETAGFATYANLLELSDELFTDASADQSGISVRGVSAKRIVWEDATKAWNFNQIVTVDETLSVGSSAAPATDSSLDLKATDKALLHNRLTTVQRDALTPVAGMEIFNTDTSQGEQYSGTVWVNTHAAGGDVVGPANSLDEEAVRFDGGTGKVIKAGSGINMPGAGYTGFGTSSIDSDTMIQILSPNNDGLKVKGVSGRLFLHDIGAGVDLKQYNIVSAGGTFRVFDANDDLATGESVFSIVGGKANFGPNLIGFEAVDSDASFQVTNQAGTAGLKVKSNIAAFLALHDTGAAADLKQVDLVSQSGELRIAQVDDDLIGSTDLVTLDLSTGFFNLDVGRFTEQAIRMSRKGTTVTEVYTAADDLPAPTTGIVLPSGKYEFKTAVTLLQAERLVVSAPGATVTLASEDVGTPITVAFSGITLNATNSAQISIIDSTFLTTEGNELFNISDSGSSFIENVRYISTTTPFGDATIGRVTNTPIVMQTCAFISVSNGLRAINSTGVLIDQVRIVSDGSDIAALIRIEDGLGDTANISGVVGATGAAGSLFYFDPIITTPVNVTSCVNVGLGTYFEAGDTGVITGITDPGGSGVVASVADVGGIAEFTDVAHGLFVGEMIRHGGFSNAEYNGDYFVSVIPTANTYQLQGVAFVASPDSGVWNVRNRRIASTAHGLSDGQTLSIFGTVNYGGGYTIFNALTNSFDISLLPLDETTSTVTETGTWDTGSLTEESKFVTLSGDNGTQKNSASIAAAFVNANTTANGTIVNNTFRDVTFGTVGAALIASSAMEGWILVDDVIGEFEYIGNRPFEGGLTYDVTSLSAGGTVNFRYKWVHDIGAGYVDLPDPVEVLQSVGSSSANASKTFPIPAVTGDRIKPQITRDSGTSSITTQYATIHLVG